MAIALIGARHYDRRRVPYYRRLNDASEPFYLVPANFSFPYQNVGERNAMHLRCGFHSNLILIVRMLMLCLVQQFPCRWQSKWNSDSPRTLFCNRINRKSLLRNGEWNGFLWVKRSNHWMFLSNIGSFTVLTHKHLQNHIFVFNRWLVGALLSPSGVIQYIWIVLTVNVDFNVDSFLLLCFPYFAFSSAKFNLFQMLPYATLLRFVWMQFHSAVWFIFIDICCRKSPLMK